jgi:uncharacterized membrane-anchored protein
MKIATPNAVEMVWFALIAVTIGFVADAADSDPEAIMRSLHPQAGKVVVSKGLAELDLGSEYRYLDPDDATTFLVKILGNPASAVTGNDGVILPTAGGETWFAILQYAPEGHVSDSDATTIDYDELLKKMKSDADADAKQRRASGYEGAELVGWSQKPFYDPSAKKLYWAKSIRFDNEPKLTLNYDVRILGREGFVNIKIVDSIEHLDKINLQMPALLSMVNFTKNNRYADYNKSTDHTAAYGLAGLIAGGVLAKVGFFKGLLALAAAFWKVIAVFVLGLFATIGNFLKRLVGRKSDQ